MRGCSWEDEKGEVESVDLNALDVISFPPGAIRRFENVRPAASGEDAVLMFVIGGNAPRAEFTDRAMKEVEELGVWPRKCLGASSGCREAVGPSSITEFYLRDNPHSPGMGKPGLQS